MKKRGLLTGVVCMGLLFALAGCGGEKPDENAVEVNYSMTFANQTGQDVEKLEIRPSEDAEWLEITLTEGEWKSSYEMPVALNGLLPEAEDGWQIQMTFAEDGAQTVWEGIQFGAEETVSFYLENGIPTAEISTEATEKAGTETPAEEEQQGIAPADTTSETENSALD